MPQPPQAIGSPATSRHLPPQHCRPAAQAVSAPHAHWPRTQRSPTPWQRSPQPPQWAVDVIVSMQVPSQHASPGPHEPASQPAGTHRPARHAWSLPHAGAQSPRPASGSAGPEPASRDGRAGGGSAGTPSPATRGEPPCAHPAMHPAKKASAMSRRRHGRVTPVVQCPRRNPPRPARAERT